MRCHSLRHFKGRWVYLIVLAMIFQLMTGIGINAEATDKLFVGGMEVQAVKVLLKDENDQPIGTVENPITTNSTIVVSYEFKLDKCKELSTESAIQIILPKALKLIRDEDIILRVKDEEERVKEVGICAVEAATGIGTIRFNDVLKAYDEATLGFKIGVKIDMSDIQAGETKKVMFEVGTKEIGVNLTFKGDEETDEKTTPPTIEKSVDGVNEAAGTIAWNVTVKAGNKGLEGAIVKEQFKSDELIFKGVQKDNATYNDYENPVEEEGKTTVRIQVPKLNANEQCIFKIITEINDKVYEVEDITKEIQNTASLTDHAGYDLTGKEATASTAIVVQWVKKSAKLVESIKNNEHIKKIEWTVTVNSNHRNIAGWTFNDYLPKGIELMKETVKLNNKAVTLNYDATRTGEKSYKDKENNEQTFTYEGMLSYSFGQQEDHNTYVFTYSTKIINEKSLDIAKYIEYINYAELLGPGQGQGMGESVHKYYDCVGKKVNIDATKKFGSYNSANHTITWSVIINGNNADLISATVEDKIPEGLALDTNTIKVQGKEIGTKDPPASQGDLKAHYSIEDRTLKIAINDTLTKECLIQFDTVVTDLSVYGTNNSQKVYKNTVNVVTQNAEDDTKLHTSAYAVVAIKSKLIDKQAGQYDYTSGTATWLIVLNESWLSIEDLVITDTIPKGQQYVEGSFKILKGKFTYDETAQQYKYGNKFLNDNELYKRANCANKEPEIVDTEEGQMLTYSCKGTSLKKMDAIYTVILKTKIDPKLTYKPGEKAKISNRASIISPTLIEGGVSSEAEKELTNSFVLKSGKQAGIDEPIEWSVVINPNRVPITDVIITDKISEELKLDTDSIKLYKVQTTVAGDIDESNREEVKFDAQNVTYYADTHTFIFSFGKDITIRECYELVFNTNVVEIKPEADYENSVSLKGATLEKEESADSKPVKTQFSDSWGKVTKKKGAIKVIKTDSETKQPLAGAEFTLSDGKVSTIVKTDEEGVALFKDISSNKIYTLTESKAPAGYQQLEGIIREIKLLDSETVEVTIENTLIKNGLQFKKVDQDERGIKGATFKLYSSKNETNYWTQTSNEEGVVTFTQIPLGKYLLKETVAPTGYKPSDTIYEVEIKDKEPASIVVQGDRTLTRVSEIKNERIKGSIKVIKVNEDQKALQGARISLLDQNKKLIGESETDKNGIAYFLSIPYGTYYIQETQAPQGYILNDALKEVKIVNDKDEIMTVVINKAEDKDKDKDKDEDKGKDEDKDKAEDKDRETAVIITEQEEAPVQDVEIGNNDVTPQETEIDLGDNKENYSTVNQSAQECENTQGTLGYAATTSPENEALPKTGSCTELSLHMLLGGIFMGLGSGISFYRRRKNK